MVEHSPAARGAAFLSLDEQVVARLRARLPAVAGHTVSAVTVEVPSYAGALSGQMGENIEGAVQIALGTFLKLVERSDESDPSTPLEPALEAAYALGRGEARSGRTMDALLAAYRVGARVAWREMSTTAVEGGLTAPTLADFAELVFAYIDELSAASVAGHADELATTGRVRQRYLERLTAQLLGGEPEAVLVASAERAGWEPPETLTAVLLPRTQVRTVLSALDPRTLEAGEDLPGLDAEDTAVLLVPGPSVGAGRQQLARLLHGRHAVMGPARPWAQVASSYRRAVRALDLRLPAADGETPVDTETHLVALLLSVDPEALDDLRARALAPLSAVRASTARRLRETLRAWLLHQGRRDEVAAALFIHPQTVRYRMGQLRDLYGDRLTDPATVLELTIALAGDPAPSDVAASQPQPRGR
jgi:hypothetical protein